MAKTEQPTARADDRRAGHPMAASVLLIATVTLLVVLLAVASILQ